MAACDNITAVYPWNEEAALKKGLLLADEVVSAAPGNAAALDAASERLKAYCIEVRKNTPVVATLSQQLARKAMDLAPDNLVPAIAIIDAAMALNSGQPCVQFVRGWLLEQEQMTQSALQRLRTPQPQLEWLLLLPE